MGIIRDSRGAPILDLPFNITNGEIPGMSVIPKHGRAIGLGSSIQTIWTGSITYTFPGSAFPMQLASTNSADICSGGVVKAVELFCINGSWDTFTEIHCLNGLNPIDITAPVLRSNRLEFLSTDKTAVNTGEIWLGNSGGFSSGIPTEKYGHIPSGAQQSYQGFYSVPRGFHSKIYDLHITTTGSREVSIWMQTLFNSEVFSGFPNLSNTFQQKIRYNIFQTPIDVTRKIPFIFSEMTDIEFRGQGSAVGSADVTVEWTNLLVGSEYLGKAII